MASALGPHFQVTPDLFLLCRELQAGHSDLYVYLTVCADVCKLPSCAYHG